MEFCKLDAAAAYSEAALPSKMYSTLVSSYERLTSDAWEPSIFEFTVERLPIWRVIRSKSYCCDSTSCTIGVYSFSKR